MNRKALKTDLIRDEGLRLKPYHDTEGNLTIGVGRNLDGNGISEAEADFMLYSDISAAVLDLVRNMPWWKELPEPAQRALANMCFNLGWPRLSSFKKMLAALALGDFAMAADEALDSKWARQVGDRALRIAQLYRDAMEADNA